MPDNRGRRVLVRSDKTWSLAERHFYIRPICLCKSCVSANHGISNEIISFSNRYLVPCHFYFRRFVKFDIHSSSCRPIEKRTIGILSHPINRIERITSESDFWEIIVYYYASVNKRPSIVIISDHPCSRALSRVYEMRCFRMTEWKIQSSVQKGKRILSISRSNVLSKIVLIEGP